MVNKREYKVGDKVFVPEEGCNGEITYINPSTGLIMVEMEVVNDDGDEYLVECDPRDIRHVWTDEDQKRYDAMSPCERAGHAQQFQDMREALSAAGVDHIGKSVAEAITLLAKQRDDALALVEKLKPSAILQALRDGNYTTVELPPSGSQ